VFNCQSCPDTYGVCGYPTCSSYTCGNAYSNGVACSTCHICSSGSCTGHVLAGSTGLNCTALHYRCDGLGACTNPITTTCKYDDYVFAYGITCIEALGYNKGCTGYEGCEGAYMDAACTGYRYVCNGYPAFYCNCWRYTY